MSARGDFIIRKGKLLRYKGPGGETSSFPTM